MKLGAWDRLEGCHNETQDTHASTNEGLPIWHKRLWHKNNWIDFELKQKRYQTKMCPASDLNTPICEMGPDMTSGG